MRTLQEQQQQQRQQHHSRQRNNAPQQQLAQSGGYHASNGFRDDSPHRGGSGGGGYADEPQVSCRTISVCLRVLAASGDRTSEAFGASLGTAGITRAVRPQPIPISLVIVSSVSWTSRIGWQSGATFHA
jgi:hypothetical protein